jgi:hypothetical protein
MVLRMWELKAFGVDLLGHRQKMQKTPPVARSARTTNVIVMTDVGRSIAVYAAKLGHSKFFAFVIFTVPWHFA